jgi:hypothetical protein
LIECVDDKNQLLIAQPGFAYQQFLFLAFTPVSIHQTLGARQLLPSRAITGIPLLASEPSLINKALHRANGYLGKPRPLGRARSESVRARKIRGFRISP